MISTNHYIDNDFLSYEELKIMLHYLGVSGHTLYINVLDRFHVSMFHWLGVCVYDLALTAWFDIFISLIVLYACHDLWIAVPAIVDIQSPPMLLSTTARLRDVCLGIDKLSWNMSCWFFLKILFTIFTSRIYYFLRISQNITYLWSVI